MMDVRNDDEVPSRNVRNDGALGKVAYITVAYAQLPAAMTLPTTVEAPNELTAMALNSCTSEPSAVALAMDGLQ